MTITTFLSQHEEKEKSGNSEIDELIAELNEKGEKLVCLSYKFYSKDWLFREKETILYSLYSRLSHGEYQLINFYSANSGSSINTMVSSDLVVAFLLGTLNGMQINKRKSNV